jgi:hypothetical protein
MFNLMDDSLAMLCKFFLPKGHKNHTVSTHRGGVGILEMTEL